MLLPCSADMPEWALQFDGNKGKRPNTFAIYVETAAQILTCLSFTVATCGILMHCCSSGLLTIGICILVCVCMPLGFCVPVSLHHCPETARPEAFLSVALASWRVAWALLAYPRAGYSC